jgi:hypothetical protein
MAERIEQAIAVLAGRQHGYAARRQLLKLGLTASDIKYRVASGRLIPVHAGVYAVGHLPVAPVAHAAAAVLACGDGALLSHGSAATLWGFDKRWRTPYEVIAGSARRRPGITVHRSSTLTRRDGTRQLGIRVTTPARTILDIAPGRTDKRLTRIVNDAGHARLLSLNGLADVLERNPHHPGANRLLRFVDTPQKGMTRSELEDAFVAFVRQYGLPEPEINHRLNGGERDILYRAEGVIVEIDSWEFHSDRTSFESDRNRDAEQLAAGIVTFRITEKRMKTQPATEAARLQAILEGAGARRRRTSYPSLKFP